MVKPQLLFLSQNLPFPADGGMNIRMYNVLRLLSREYQVTALCFFRQAMRPTPEQVAASVAGLSELARVEAFPIEQEYSRARLLTDHLGSLLSRRVYTVAAYESAAYRRRLDELLRTETFDVVHLDSIDLSGYLPAVLGTAVVVCAHHNVESSLLRRRAEVEVSRLRRLYLGYQASLMEEEERRWCPRVSLNTVVSAEDRALFQELVPDASFCVVPNGVDTAEFRPATGSQSGLVFVGGYDWFPNRDALEFFCDAILPLVRARSPEIAIEWVGRAPDEVRSHYAAEHGLQLTGYVDDFQPYVHRSACYVVPLRVGGGTRLKILDAWAMGKAVVSTSIGCEGLDARDGENILIADTPEAFAIAIERVLSDESLRERLGAAARRTAESTYEWEVIGSDMYREYRRLHEAVGERASRESPLSAAR